MFLNEAQDGWSFNKIKIILILLTLNFVKCVENYCNNNKKVAWSQYLKKVWEYINNEKEKIKQSKAWDELHMILTISLLMAVYSILCKLMFIRFMNLLVPSCSGDLVKEIKALVHRHPDKLNVGCCDVFRLFYDVYLLICTFWSWCSETDKDDKS